MQTRIEAYKPEHLAMIVGREYEREMEAIARAAGIRFDTTFATGPGYTLLADGAPVMAGGIVPTWRKGIGEAWMHLSAWVEQHPRTAARTVYRMMGAAITEMEFHRVEAAICASMPRNRSFAEFIGFRREGLMKRWGPDGRDYYQYAMVAPEGQTLCRRPQ